MLQKHTASLVILGKKFSHTWIAEPIWLLHQYYFIQNLWKRKVRIFFLISTRFNASFQGQKFFPRTLKNNFTNTYAQNCYLNAVLDWPGLKAIFDTGAWFSNMNGHIEPKTKVSKWACASKNTSPQGKRKHIWVKENIYSN